MWDEARGLFLDVHHPPGATTYRRNQHEDLRSYAPLWAGVVGPSSHEAKAMARRVSDFMRPGGLATATRASWDELHAMNPAYVGRCQWGHKDVGWPITTYETATSLRRAGFVREADEIAYRWCHMVLAAVAQNGGPQVSPHGAIIAPIAEKMDVTQRSTAGAASIGYGNQGLAEGFRWGCDAFKLLARELPGELQDGLGRGTDPELLFGPELQRLLRLGR
jgi:neutral trehalase